MTTREIQNLLALLNTTQADLARLTGFSESEVSKILSGARRNPELRSAIVRALQNLRASLTEEQIFGPDFEAAVRARGEQAVA